MRPIPQCQLGFLYGFGYLCRHPEIGRIIARTQARPLDLGTILDCQSCPDAVSMDVSLDETPDATLQAGGAR